MEGLHCPKKTGEQTGDQEQHQSESLQQGLRCKSPSQPSQQDLSACSKSHGTAQLPKLSRRHNPERKRLRHQRQSIVSDIEHKQERTKEASVSSSSSEALPCTQDISIQSASETQEDNPKQKRERKPQKPGKYVCTYCGRACAKPSVLQKHIRSHTGERPYPCAPCGFSFKTKSNLYKHRKSHTHRVKAGLALGEAKGLEEQVTESEDETQHLSSASALTHRQNSVAPAKGSDAEMLKDSTGASSDSYAVKKRLALRLSRGKHGSQDSSDDKTSSLTLSSRGSTESGYFSRSESTEQSQDSPPNTSAKTYAEIILGKYGRLGQLQRMSRHHNQHLPGHEEKNISFAVPKKQVIDHITKLITINEAVVDTSKIDSVKPRRFSLTRKNSSEAQKSLSIKEPLIHSSKSGNLSYKTTGSISMGVPCEKFLQPSLKVEQPSSQISTTSMVRSLSLPSPSTSLDTSGLSKFRQTQSFDEHPSESKRRFGTLRRQPAIEIPICAEPTKDEQETSNTFSSNSVTTVSDQKPRQPEPNKCEACGTGCIDWEGYRKHKQNLCCADYPQNETIMSSMESSQLSYQAVRAGVSTMRKRRKEESFDSDDLSYPPLSSSVVLSSQCKGEIIVGVESLARPTLQTCSVIQHTSLFEKQESSHHEYQSLKVTNSPPHNENLPSSKTQPLHQSVKLKNRKLVRQNNVQVPEILVTEDSNIGQEKSKEPNLGDKKLGKLDDFHWPQRSPSLAQLPIEKLPPKKKRLRLAEAAQSSGDSSFESMSLPHSPSQDSSASYTSSRSTSFEEQSRPDVGITASAALRRSRASHTLAVPGLHHQREIRRSASEQAPHDLQSHVLLAENRSKSFDYSCLSPERSAVGWKERRKCLLMRHKVIRDQDDEEGHGTVPSHHLEHASSDTFFQESQTSVSCSRSSSPPLSSVRVLGVPEGSQCKEICIKWTPNIHSRGSTELSKSYQPSVDVKKESSIHPEYTYGASGAARALYHPVSTGLKLEIPPRHQTYAEVHSSYPQFQQRVPHISGSGELRPLTSQAVAVRLQTDTLTPACAIYTSLSQSVSHRPPEAFDNVLPNVNILMVEFRTHQKTSLDLQPWSDEGPRFPGSSGNKRMLSPSNSIELQSESQQQQKRIKEEDKEVGCAETASLNTSSQNRRLETLSCLPDVSSPISRAASTFPSLLSSTCNSWCYLNYIKPNPSIQKSSVYSTWSTSDYDPNPSGLTSKTVLSLLHCKQRPTSSIYTTPAMMVGITESIQDEDRKRLCSTEVYSSPRYCTDHKQMAKVQQTEDIVLNKASKKNEMKRQEQEVTLFSGNKQPLEKRSDDQLGVVCGECDRKCKGELRNSTVHSEQSQTSLCELCSNSPEAPVALGECLIPEVREEDRRSHYTDTHEGTLKYNKANPDEKKDISLHALGKHAAHGDDDGLAEHYRHGEGSRSSFTEVSHTNSKEVQEEGQLMDFKSSSSLPLNTKDDAEKCSASVSWALFARRHLNASTSTSAGSSHSPHNRSANSGREHPPPCSLSTRTHQSAAPLSSLSPSACPVSPVLNSAASPVRDQNKGPDSSGLPGSPAGPPAQSQTCSQPKDSKLNTILLREETTSTPNISNHGTQPGGTNRLLSHLPLHSQQPSRTQSLLIPIGGIHMVQPRSTLPLYSLVGSQTASTISRESPKRKLAVPQKQEDHKEKLESSRGGPQSPPAAEQTPREDKNLTTQQASTFRTGPEHKERHVYSKGHNTSGSSQKHL
ncbi:PREDICTED: transcription factor HIVEP3-like [Cyprinodon variegatus]|uniref:HIVEP zinc finger 3a n=1 Tax=Cyprinodon variegatus TaxID=28743 RepID=A0A3Q2CPV3_CYPVA|nr:PREDICTED: transcription factor HIVEP3-like [Cyprinodon variegatus]XP_015251335.1 PREDICTED: transcription factor HIVEP3-like [Cyprinodon variegatus]XP_015251336.1 PREDICTED: transcription factor HIVEP3-like [Cyprinodon variegatus]